MSSNQSSDLFDFDPSPFSLELELTAQGFRLIAGVDEVGRGALAGPVVAAAVILGPTAHVLAGRVRDSKKMRPDQREAMFPEIEAHAIAIGVGMIEADEIDRINILGATLKAMSIALSQLDPQADLCLVDGNQKIPIPTPQRLIIKGDDRVLSIAAASVIAKVTRDRIMAQRAVEYPPYSFEENKGYGTDTHRKAIVSHGACPIHRRTFLSFIESSSINSLPSAIQLG